MKQLVYSFLFLACLGACKKQEKNQMQLTGAIAGLKKGTLYLQRVQNSALVTVDSLVINGDSRFTFQVPLESPEVFYLHLEKNDANPLNDHLLFFAEPGTINIQTTRDFFEVEAVITGSATQQKWEEYQKNRSRFSDQRLEFIKSQLEAKKENRQQEADSIQRLIEKNMVRSYLFALNFALNNKNSCVAPYIALTEVYDAQSKYIDTIYKALTPEVAASKYGKALGEYVKKLHANKAAH